MTQILKHAIEKFMEEYPSSRRSVDVVENYYKRFYNALTDQLIKHRRKSGELNNGYWCISLDELNTACDKFEYKGVRYPIYKTCNGILPLFQIVALGNNLREKLTVIDLTDNYIKILLQNDAAADLMDIVRKNIVEYLSRNNSVDNSLDTIELVPVDLKSLKNYIANTSGELQSTHNSHNSHYSRALLDHLLAAKFIYTVAEHCDGLFPQIPVQNLFGRTYYRGTNLQNVSRVVRNAALGQHYQYDLKTSVFSVLLTISKSLITVEEHDSWYKKYSHITEYVRNKKYIRTRYAKIICGNEKPNEHHLEQIKTLLTALSFGGKMNSGSWYNSDGDLQQTAINTAIRNPEARTRLCNDTHFKNFVGEVKELNRHLLGNWDLLVDIYNLVDRIENIKTDKVIAQLSSSQKLSLLYQLTETAVMDKVCATLHEPPILRIHDAFITKKPIPNLLEVRELLHEFSEFMDVECDEFQPWILREEYDPHIVEHREHMRAEQLTVERITGIKHNPQVKHYNYAKQHREGHYTGEYATISIEDWY